MSPSTSNSVTAEIQTWCKKKMSEEEVVPDNSESDEEDEFYESISFDVSQAQVEPPVEPEIEGEQIEPDVLTDRNDDGSSTVQTGLNITKDIVNISNSVAMTGFKWASIGTEYGFGWTTSLLENSKAVLERYEMSESSLAKAVTAAQAAVEVAKGITVAGLNGAEYITAKTHSYADSALGKAGAKDGTLYKIMARKLMQSDDAGDAVVAILEFFYEFCEGHDIPLQQLPRALILLAQLHKLCLKKPDQYSCKVLNGPALRADLTMYHNFVLGAAGINMLRLQGIISVMESYESEDECTAVMAGIGVEDILFRIPSKEIFMTSTYVALNRSRGEICVVFSGTSNHHDLLTDLTCKTADWECNGETLQIHEGFAKTVNLLEPILLPVVSQYRQEYGFETVVCVGYSFGAAVASLVTLKWSRLFPTIRAYAFAPPGVAGLEYALLSTGMTVSVPLIRKKTTDTNTSTSSSSSTTTSDDVNTSGSSSSSVESTGEFTVYPRITGVILGNDMVPRLSLSSAEDLRDCIAYLLGNTEVMSDIEDAFKRYDAMLAKSAAAITASNFMHDNEGEGPAVAGVEDEEDDQQFRECSEDAVQLVAMLSEFDAIYRELVDTHCFRKNKLLPLGQLLFLEVVDTAAEPHTRILEAKAGQFSSIVVCGDMLTCHLNNAYKTALDSV